MTKTIVFTMVMVKPNNNNLDSTQRVQTSADDNRVVFLAVSKNCNSEQNVLDMDPDLHVL